MGGASAYITNWGTHEVMFRLPRRLLPPDAVRPYAAAESVDPHVLGDVVILDRKARARTAYLDELAGKQEQTWRRVETLIEMKKAAEYDQALTYLRDLRDLSAREGTAEQFQRQLRARHSGKRAFLDRIPRAKLRD